MAIAIKAMQRLLYMIKVQQWSIRTNPTANDLAALPQIDDTLYINWSDW
jgi:hypothetical protein